MSKLSTFEVVNFWNWSNIETGQILILVKWVKLVKKWSNWSEWSYSAMFNTSGQMRDWSNLTSHQIWPVWSLTNLDFDQQSNLTSLGFDHLLKIIKSRNWAERIWPLGCLTSDPSLTSLGFEQFVIWPVVKFDLRLSLTSIKFDHLVKIAKSRDWAD